MDDRISTTEAAAVLGTSSEWVRLAFHEGLLDGVQLKQPHGRIRICPRSVQRLQDAAQTPTSRRAA